VGATGQIGALIILEETAVAAGTRRLEAVCGQAAVAEVRRMRSGLGRMRQLLGSSTDDLVEKVEGLLSEASSLRKELRRARRGEGLTRLDSLFEAVEQVGARRFLVGRVEAASADELRQLGDRVRERLGEGAALLCADSGKKVSFLAVVTDQLADEGRVQADAIVRAVAGLTGGGGGGKPRLALGGAGDPAKVPEALEGAKQLLRELLAKD
jgi:alanyl-tRNA synthetase